MLALLSAALLVGSALGQTYYKAVATFTEAASGISGTVEVTGGMFKLMLNLTNAMPPTTVPNLPACFANDVLSYHIHNKWNTSRGTSSNYMGCDSGQTGGHWDPWFACGPATGSDDCHNKNGCVNRGVYNCNPNNKPGCEIGDWSGKYSGVFTNTLINNSTASRMATMVTRWEANAKSLEGKSVVLHCASGARLACASFVVSTGGMAKPMTGFTYATRYVADFGSIGGPQVYFGGDQIQYSAPFTCSGAVTVMVHNNWTSSSNALMGTACTEAVHGKVYDPYYSCVMGTEQTTACTYNAQAMTMTRCSGTKNTMVTYNTMCTTMTPFDCAAGDLTGRVAAPTAAGNITDPLLPMVTTGSVVVKCGATSVWCAKIQKADMTYVGDVATTSSAHSLLPTSILMAVFSFFFVN